MWNVLSGELERIRYGADYYRRHRWEMSSVMEKLFERYKLEGLVMPYTMEEFQRQYVKEHLDVLKPEEILHRFKPEERLEGLKPEEIRALLEKLQKEQRKASREES